MAYAIYKEMERRLYENKTKISIEKAIAEIADIQQLTYTLPRSQEVKSKLLQLSQKKKQIIEIAQN